MAPAAIGRQVIGDQGTAPWGAGPFELTEVDRRGRHRLGAIRSFQWLARIKPNGEGFRIAGYRCDSGDALLRQHPGVHRYGGRLHSILHVSFTKTVLAEAPDTRNPLKHGLKRAI